jgi:hypothetical protein
MKPPNLAAFPVRIFVLKPIHSLVSQRFDGFQICSSFCRIKSEEQTDGCGEQRRQQDGIDPDCRTQINIGVRCDYTHERRQYPTQASSYRTTDHLEGADLICCLHSIRMNWNFNKIIDSIMIREKALVL